MNNSDGLCHFTHYFVTDESLWDKIQLGVLSSTIRYPSPDSESEERIEKLYDAIEKLTPKQKKVIQLHLSGCSQVEIAELLNIKQSGISVCLYGRRYKDGSYNSGIIQKLQRLMKKE